MLLPMFLRPISLREFIARSAWRCEKIKGQPSRRKQNKCRRAYKKYMLSLGQRGV